MLTILDKINGMQTNVDNSNEDDPNKDNSGEQSFR